MNRGVRHSAWCALVAIGDELVEQRVKIGEKDSDVGQIGRKLGELATRLKDASTTLVRHAQTQRALQIARQEREARS